MHRATGITIRTDRISVKSIIMKAAKNMTIKAYTVFSSFYHFMYFNLYIIKKQYLLRFRTGAFRKVRVAYNESQLK